MKQIMRTLMMTVTAVFVSYAVLAETDISSAHVSPLASVTATGSAITPLPTVTCGSTVLVNGTDYDLEYSDNLSVGRATVKIVAKGAYTGTRTAYFYILGVGDTSVEKFVDPAAAADGDGSAATPYRTLAEVTPADGMRVRLAEGVHAVSAVFDVRSRSDFALTGLGPKAAIEPGTGYAGVLMKIVKSSNVTVKDVVFRNAANAGAASRDADIQSLTTASSALGVGAYGGAILAADSADVLISGCEFKGNTVCNSTNGANNRGGAIFMAWCQGFHIDNTRFEANRAATTGAAICSYNREIEVVCTLTNVQFIANVGGERGYVIWGDGTAMDLKNCLFMKNEGTGDLVRLSDQNKSEYRNPSSTDYNKRWYGTSYVRDTSFIWNRSNFAMTLSAIETPIGYIDAYVTNTVVVGTPYISGYEVMSDQSKWTIQDSFWVTDQPDTPAVQKSREYEPHVGSAGRVLAGDVAEGHGYVFPADWPANVSRVVNVSSVAELQSAISDLRSGDRIRIAPGTYSIGAADQFLFANVDDLEVSGTGDGVIFDGGELAHSATPFVFSSVNGLVVSNIAVRNVNSPVKLTNGKMFPLAFRFTRTLNSKVDSLSVSNCNFICTSSSASGILVDGALITAGDYSQIEFSRLLLEDCVFDTSAINQAQKLRGFMDVDGGIHVRNSVFRDLTFNSRHADSRLFGVLSGRNEAQYAVGATDVTEYVSRWKRVFRVFNSVVLRCGRSQADGASGRCYIAAAGTGNNSDCNAHYYNCAFAHCYGNPIGIAVNARMLFANCVFTDITKAESNEDLTNGKFRNMYRSSPAAGNIFFKNCQFDVPYTDLNPDTYAVTIDLANGCLSGDPLVDENGKPTDTDLSGLSSLVDAGSSRPWMTYLGYSSDVVGNARQVGYKAHGSGLIDIGAYELPEIAYRLETEDAEIPYDGEPHGPIYQVIRNVQEVVPVVSFSDSPTGPWTDVEPSETEGGLYTFWIKVAAEGYEPSIKSSTIWIVKKISGNVYIAPGGTGDGKTPESPLGSLQEAFSLAAPGSTLHLAAGEYEGFPKLEKFDSLTIDGAGAAVFKPETDNLGGKVRGRLLTLVGVTNIVVRGVAFRGAERVAGPFAADEPATLSDYIGTSSSGAYGAGAYVVQSSNVTFEACTFADNSISGVNSADVGFGAGLAVIGSAAVTVRDSSFTGNSANATGSGRGGALFASISTGFAVSNCVFTGNFANSYGPAIYLDYTEARLSNDLLVRNFGNNAALEMRGVSEAQVSVDHLTIADNRTTYGLVLEGYGSSTRVVSDTVVSGQRSVGAYLQDSKIPRVATEPTFGANNFWSGDGYCDKTSEWKPKLDYAYHPTPGGNVAVAGAGYRFTDAAPVGRNISCSTALEFATALADLRDYDTITLAAGDYQIDLSGIDAQYAYVVSNRLEVTIRGAGAGARFLGTGDAATDLKGFLKVVDSWNFKLENVTFGNLVYATDGSYRAFLFERTANARLENVRIENCQVTWTKKLGYSQVGNGAFFHMTDSTMDLHRCAFVGNIATFNDGLFSNNPQMFGVFVYNDRIVLMRECVFTDNRARFTSDAKIGGMLYDATGVAVIGMDLRNCLLARNGALDGSSGVRSVCHFGWGTGFNCWNCTFVSNSIPVVFHDHHARVTIGNCVFSDNAEGSLARSVNANYIQVYNSYFDLPYGSGDTRVPAMDSGAVSAEPETASGNIFGTVVGAVGFKDLAHGDYRLTAGSPCVDSAGRETAIYQSWMSTYDGLDLDARSRVVTMDKAERKAGLKRPDIGCYELPRDRGFIVIVR